MQKGCHTEYKYIKQMIEVAINFLQTGAVFTNFFPSLIRQKKKKINIFEPSFKG